MSDAVYTIAAIVSLLASAAGLWSAIRRRQLMRRLLRSLDAKQLEALGAVRRGFDADAARFGWQYDNGGRYQDNSWDWYYSAEHQYGEAGNIVLARQPSGLAVLLHFRGLDSAEIWRGTVAGASDLERATRVLEQYIATHQLRSGAAAV